MVSAWTFLVALAPLTSVVAQYAAAPAAKIPLLLDATAEELTFGLEMGSFTSVDLVHVRSSISMKVEVANGIQAYVARIMEVNATLHMVTEINPDAVAIAKDLDYERACGKLRGYVTVS